MNQRQIFTIVLVHDIKYATSKAQTLHALYCKKIGAKELYLLCCNYHTFNYKQLLNTIESKEDFLFVLNQMNFKSMYQKVLKKVKEMADVFLTLANFF